ncbi:MAG: hypothetical protein C5B43_02305 [Verrucomicrobia bacterium]|nr:MAG: hypothetical protein C5B43_02305 [Verrucomicrobiota bacterium]
MGYIGSPTQTAGGGTTQNVNITQVGGASLALGQTTMALSIPVVIASNQSAISVTPAANSSVNVNQWAGSALGTPTNFGTTPTAVIAGSVNASIFAGTTALTQTGNALDVNLKTSSITLNVSAAQSGNWTSRIVGNAGAILDAATAASVPANALYDGKRGTTALPTAVTDGQMVGAMADKFGRQVVIPTTIRDLVSSQTTTINNSTSETTIVTAGAAGVFNDLLSLVVINTSASALRVDFRDSTAGTIIFALYLPAGDTRGISWQVPLPQTTAANNWTAQCASSVSDVRILAQFAKNK